ncbi:uncharacterized protein LOC142335285 isoform X2 [Convolutriloba macropyga]|uniref:uncharacterized protein LOC142335285 isoform X2 n=1 Tax=Convolutriloba macropyga TaxID=536237 RepID=UPI003F52613B
MRDSSALFGLAGKLAARKSGVSLAPQFVREANYVDRIEPHRYTINCARFQKDLDVNSDLKAKVTDCFNRVGLVHLVETGTRDAFRLRGAFSHLLGVNCNSMFAGAGHVGELGEERAQNEMFTPYHHTMQFNPISCKSVAFLCSDFNLKNGKGSSFFMDNVSFTTDIERRPIGRKLLQEGIRVTIKWPDVNTSNTSPSPPPFYRFSWQSAFSTDDPNIAVAKAKKMRFQDIEWDRDGSLRAVYYPSIYEYCPIVDRNLLFLSLSEETCFSRDQLPHDYDKVEPWCLVTFGDGTEFSEEEVEQMVRVADNHGIQFNWRPGEAVLACNYRFAHGQPDFRLEKDEKREIATVYGELFNRIGPLPGKFRLY